MDPKGRLAERIRSDIGGGGESSVPLVVLAAVFAGGDVSRLQFGELQDFAAGHGWVIARAAGESLTFKLAAGGS
jgi:hypothetical protein